jgi:hypothetical protein
MDASLVFIDSPERGTVCIICHVLIQDKTPSSKARHLRTKMHQNSVRLALSQTSKDLSKFENQDGKQEKKSASDLASNGDSENSMLFSHYIKDFDFSKSHEE